MYAAGPIIKSSARLSLEPLEPRFLLTAVPLAGAYTDPNYFTDVPFGSQSAYLQPWRAYLQTTPASTFLNGTGINLDLSSGENANLIVKMLAKEGIHNARIEIGWSDIDYNNPLQLDNISVIQAELQACAKWGVRPLILLNGNQGAPCPMQGSILTVTANAPAGATQVQLSYTANLTVGYSGLSNLTGYWAAQSLVTAINGNTVTLSQPIPNAISAGTNVPIQTLKYRPFSVPGSADYNATIAGWQNYVGVVAQFVAATLGTTGKSDVGFDMEVWNELSFGSNFLSITNYYNPNPYSYVSNSIWANLVQATANEKAANPKLFSGVLIGDGFGNTIPWTASSTEPAGITAVDKHPYSDAQTFPADIRNGTNINALGQTDTYVPSYTEVFPEYDGSAIQTETMVRDMGPITNTVAGTLHGENARPGVVTPVWVTEANIAPDGNGVTSETAALYMKEKDTARYFSFYLNKGVTQFDLFDATGGDTGDGIVQDNFLAYSMANTLYPANDSSYVSPALAVTGRIAAQMSAQLDPTLKITQQLTVNSVIDVSGHYQFAGNGTAADPNLYDNERFAFLPYQVNSTRLVIPYYVMTEDVRQNLEPENMTIQVSGLNGIGASLKVYDPINDVYLPLTINSVSGTMINVTLPTTDYPYLLIVQEAQAKALPSPWKDTDIGAPKLAGSASDVNGLFTVSGGGSDIWNSSDQFNYVYQPMTGNGAIIAKLTTEQKNNSWAKAGVMIRQSLAANSPFIDLVVSPGNGISVQSRSITNGASVDDARLPSLTAPYWLELSRNGSLFTASISTDGIHWKQVGQPVKISMSTAVEIGMAVTAHNNLTLNTSTFNNVSVSPMATPAAADSNNDVYQSLPGNNTFIARIDSQQTRIFGLLPLS